MLTFLGMEFEGNPHSGLDDSYNISRICIQLLEDGAFIDQNERIISLKNLTSFGKDVIIFIFRIYVFKVLSVIECSFYFNMVNSRGT